MPDTAGRQWWRRLREMSDGMRRGWMQQRDTEDGSKLTMSADLDAFVRHLARTNGDASTYTWDTFDDLWTDYAVACGEMDMRPVTPRALQNAWSSIGGSKSRPNTGEGPRKTIYTLELPAAQVVPLNRAA